MALSRRWKKLAVPVAICKRLALLTLRMSMLDSLLFPNMEDPVDVPLLTVLELLNRATTPIRVMLVR